MRKKLRARSRLGRYEADIRNNKLFPVVLLASSIVLSIYCYGYGQIKTMLESTVSESVVYAKTVSITPAPTVTPTKAPELEYAPSKKALTLMERDPGLTRKIRDTFGSEWRYAAELISREASFNKFAINPTSGACGLAQALPCTKLTKKCALEDEQCQLNWIKDYCNNRYGGVKKAVEFHDEKNWY